MTTREHQVLQILPHGWTTKQMAQELRLQPSSVETYIRNLYRKTGLSKREALVWWWAHHVVSSQTGP